MKIKAIRIQGKDLKAGDLYSMMGQLYWDRLRDPKAVAEKILLRIEKSLLKEDEGAYVYKLIINK